jgi:hypothetical protein
MLLLLLWWLRLFFGLLFLWIRGMLLLRFRVR